MNEVDSSGPEKTGNYYERRYHMGYTIGLPSMKLKNTKCKRTKHIGSLRSIAEEALIERRGIDEDINHELTHLNEYLTEIHSARELMDYSEKWIQAYNESVDLKKQIVQKQIDEAVTLFNDGREQPLSKLMALNEINKERKAQGLPPFIYPQHIKADAVVMCVTIIKVPIEYMDFLSHENQRRILLDGFEKMKDIVRADNIKAAVIHWDETSPHIHIFWQPVTPDGKLKGYAMHNIKFYGRLNEEMPKYLRERGWDIDPCHIYNRDEAEKLREEIGDEAYRQLIFEKRSKNGRSSMRYKYDVMKEIEQAEANLADINQMIARQVSELDKIQKRNAEAKSIFDELEEQLIMAQQAPEPPKAPKGNRPCGLQKWLETNVHETNPLKRHRAEKDQTAIWQSLNQPFVDYERELQQWREQFGIINLEQNRAFKLQQREAVLKQKEQELEKERQQVIELKNTLVQNIINQVDATVQQITEALPQDIREQVIEVQRRETEKLKNNHTARRKRDNRDDFER